MSPAACLTDKLNGLQAGLFPGLIVPLTAGQPAALLAEAEAVPADRVDWLEWRLDFFEPAIAEARLKQPSVSRALLTLICGLEAACQKAQTPPLLLTWRTRGEGGNCLARTEWYLDLLEQLVRCGAPAIDLEFSTCPVEFRKKLIALANSKGTVTILSKHHFTGTPDLADLCLELSRLTAAGPDFVKLACMPLKEADVYNLLIATARLSAVQTTPLITMSMGKKGTASRLLGHKFGSRYTFVTVGDSSAPGQLPLTYFLKWQAAYQQLQSL